MKKLSTILLIDDDSINNFINERLIKKMDVCKDIKISMNGAEAIAFLENSHRAGHALPELILLDINMPVMDGFEFIEAYRKLDIPEKNSVIIVMLTTSTNPGDTTRLNRAGVRDYVNKPLTEDKLRVVIEQYFN